ncbi:hypothetical protein GCM10008959_34600 [Deinococcus seoulensis]|uniref:Uncharacterized protein n=1 Tax=Deinococcus seoulensis TaxID=1837379 RepID=A0ABQ2RWM8_9DEIO|nr:hypothetical protein GCM10008959_34600 [Deinococcus seoulensis]
MTATAMAAAWRAVVAAAVVVPVGLAGAGGVGRRACMAARYPARGGSGGVRAGRAAGCVRSVGPEGLGGAGLEGAGLGGGAGNPAGERLVKVRAAVCDSRERPAALPCGYD